MTHYVVIHALMVSWYLRRRPNNPTGDVMMDIDPWKSYGMVEAIQGAHESPWHVKEYSFLMKNT